MLRNAFPIGRIFPSSSRPETLLTKLNLILQENFPATYRYFFTNIVAEEIYEEIEKEKSGKPRYLIFYNFNRMSLMENFIEKNFNKNIIL